MPLPSSGTISLNQIHVEAGGGSGTSATINDSDIRGLIGKGSGSQMSFSEWYGASAGPSYVSAAYGTAYQAATTGKNAAPAGIRFYSSTAQAQVNASTTTNNGHGWWLSDLGFWNGSSFGGTGIIGHETISGGYTIVQSSTYNWTKSHGTGSGQHYFKIYYGSTLICQTNQQYDPNGTEALGAGNHSSGVPSIGAGRTNAGAWRIEYYA